MGQGLLFRVWGLGFRVQGGKYSFYWLVSTMSQVLRLILEGLFGQKQPELGIQLTSPDGTSMRLHFRLGMVLQDGAAHKFVWGNRQDSGCKPCMLCNNIFQLKDESQEDNVLMQFLRKRDLCLSTDEEVLDAWTRLGARRVPAKQFEDWQKAVGMTSSTG